MKKQFISILLFSLLAIPAEAAMYNIDIDHSTVAFNVKHLMISDVKGSFKKFGGTFDYEPGKSETWKIKATIDTASIDTNKKERDDHLKSPEFFDVAKYPKMTFESTEVLDSSKDLAKIKGNLTMHGVTKPVELDVKFGGLATDPWGNKRAAFSATTEVNRKDFGMVWNKALETGGVVVGDMVKIALDVEGIEKAAEVKKAKKK